MKVILTSVFTAAALVAACRPAGGGSPAAPVPDPVHVQDPTSTPSAAEEPADSAPRLLDLSGSFGNKVELEGNLGLGSASFPFLPDRGGTLLLIDLDYDYGTCQKSRLEARLFLHFYGTEGQLERVYELERMRPLRLARKEAYQLVIQLKAHEECHGAAVSVAMRYYAPRPTETASGTDSIDGAGDGGGDGTDGSTDGGTDGGGGTNGGDPGRPNPCPALPGRTDLPANLRGGFVVHGRRSLADGCEPTLTWKIAENLKSLDPPACTLPKTRFEARAGAPALFKAFDTRPDFDFNLFWLRIADSTRADAVKQALEEGRTIDLVAGPNDCNLPAAPTTIVMEDDLDLMLFSGDPRDACLGERGPADMMDLNPVGSDAFQVSYQYGSNDPAHFFWRARFALPRSQATGSLAQGTRARLYNRRVRGFVSDWVTLTGQPDALTMELTDPSVLRRVLPYQSDLEIVMAPADSTPSCSVAYAVPYHRIFLDSSLNSRFSDGTQSGRSRFLLKESDLPL